MNPLLKPFNKKEKAEPKVPLGRAIPILLLS